MRVTDYGHSCLLVESQDARVLIDPGGFSRGYTSLGDLSAIVVTHQHPDHLDLDGLGQLLELNPDVPVHVDPGTAQDLSFDRRTVRDLDLVTTRDGMQATFGDLTLDFVGQWHAVIFDELPRVTNVGVVLRDGQTSLYHPGDALDVHPENVDVLAVPVSAPWCAVKETIDFVRRVDPAQGIIPIHDGLLVPPARATYLGHIKSFGDPTGQLIDLVHGETATL